MKHAPFVHLVRCHCRSGSSRIWRSCGLLGTLSRPSRASPLDVQRRAVSSPMNGGPSGAVPQPHHIGEKNEGAAPVRSTAFPPEDTHTLALIYGKVPSFYVSVAQIARQLPEEIMGPLSTCVVGNRRGLSAFLSCHPLCFELSVQGRVAVVRRREGGDAHTRQTMQTNRDAKTGSSEASVKSHTDEAAKTVELARLIPKIPAESIEPYEWYRVARLFPDVHTEVLVSADLEKSAADLLPEGHDLLSVCLSAPSLFAVRVGDSTSEGDAPPAVYIRFLLHPKYAGTSTLSAEALECKLHDIAVPRKKKRTLTRELAIKRKPLPYLDECVMAHYLFDLLPPDTYISRADLLNQLPHDIFACLPIQLGRLWEGYPHLFSVVPLEEVNEIALQRADLPLPKTRTAEDIALEEVLMEVFNRYPLKRHPLVGTNLFRCLNKLPRFTQERIYAIRDVEKEFVRAFPDKIEPLVLPAVGDPTYEAIFALVNPPHSQLMQASGRTDLFLPFRFVGEWYDQLLKQYTKVCVRHKVDPSTTFVVDHIKRK